MSIDDNTASLYIPRRITLSIYGKKLRPAMESIYNLKLQGAEKDVQALELQWPTVKKVVPPI